MMEGSWWRNLQKKTFIETKTNMFFFFPSLFASFFCRFASLLPDTLRWEFGKALLINLVTLKMSRVVRLTVREHWSTAWRPSVLESACRPSDRPSITCVWDNTSAWPSLKTFPPGEAVLMRHTASSTASNFPCTYPEADFTILAHYLPSRSVNLLHYHRIGFQTQQTFWPRRAISQTECTERFW